MVGHIEDQVSGIERAIARTEREIALFREYRTTLTADVVTGKLDVRIAAAALPDVAEVPPPRDGEEIGETEVEELEDGA